MPQTLQRVEKSLVPTSDPCSVALNPASVVLWSGFLGVLSSFWAADRSDNDFFNSLDHLRSPYIPCYKSAKIRSLRDTRPSSAMQDTGVSSEGGRRNGVSNEYGDTGAFGS